MNGAAAWLPRRPASREKLLSYTDLAMLDRLVTPTDALGPKLMP